MTLDSEEQRSLLLGCIASLRFAGGDEMDKIYEVKQAIKQAPVTAKVEAGVENP